MTCFMGLKSESFIHSVFPVCPRMTAMIGVDLAIFSMNLRLLDDWDS